MPRVVIASRIYAPEPAAAAYRLGALGRALARRGAVVDVLTSRAPQGGTADAGVRVRRWPVLRDASGAVRGYLPYASYDVPLLLRLALARRPDVVVVEPPPTTGAVAAAVCALRRVPYVYYAADLLSVAAAGSGVSPVVVRVLRAVEGLVLRRAARVLTVSDPVADVVRGFGVRDDRLEVVGSGVDVDAFSSEPVAPQQEELLVYAGTMSEVHGAGLFVEAFARVAAAHPRARLVMFGGGVDREAMRARADALVPGRVTFPGPVPAAEVAAAFRRARAGLASLRPGGGYEFALVTKVFAATACGAPVVYAGPGPCAGLVRRHGLGWAVEHTAEAVAGAMAQALAAAPAPAERRRLAAWTRADASLTGVADRAAAAVLGVAGARGGAGSTP
ncbi:glycosyltransferase [Kineococcus sp. R8]|uniref:glycosyltransferase n=1 Tax=Kineococcus siccus TaxID=2696567 RepID=UPI001411E92D|nr:glycosyltransferase [Kineococcus siccus]